MNTVLVIYHANCMDGFAAAWTARRYLGPDHTYLPHSHGQPFDPTMCKDREVFLLDYSFKRPMMEKIRDTSSRLIVIDHHKTAASELEGFFLRPNDTLVFSMEHSGSYLSWCYFNHNDWDGKSESREWVPQFIQYIQDRDLWRYALPDSRSINDAIASYPMTWDSYEELYDRCEWLEGRRELDKEGGAIGRYKDQYVNFLASMAVEVSIGGYQVLASNVSGNLTSEVAGALSTGRTFGAAYYRAKEGHWVYSLRSRDGGVDVSEVAKSYGGGGHRNAAGFQSQTLL